MAEIRDNATRVEVYRSLDAAPETWDDARFWLIGELRRIQTGFYSVDEVIAELDTAVEAPNSPSEGVQGPIGPIGPAGPEGPTGPQGASGADGVVGDLIDDNSTGLTTTWSSQKINQLFQTISPAPGGSGSITIGPDAPSNPAIGDLWFENVITLELYVFTDQSIWVSVTGAGGGGGKDVIVSPTAPVTTEDQYLWIQTGLGDSGECFTVWFNDPNY